MQILERINDNPLIGIRYVGLKKFAKELLLTHYVEKFMRSDELIPDMLYEIDFIIEEHCLPNEQYETIVLLNDVKESLEHIYYE